MHEVLVNLLGGLSLPRKSVFRLTDSPDMTLDVYCGHKTTEQQQQQLSILFEMHLYGLFVLSFCNGLKNSRSNYDILEFVL